MNFLKSDLKDKSILAFAREINISFDDLVGRIQCNGMGGATSRFWSNGFR